MIIKQGSEFYLCCDQCSNEEGPFDEFSEAARSKKIQGWKSVRYGEVWADKCPDCFTSQITKTKDKTIIDFGG